MKKIRGAKNGVSVLSEAKLREMLLTKQHELLAKIRRDRGGLREGTVELAEASVGGLGDRPVLTPEAEIGYAVVDRQAHVLGQINLALKKLEEGTYGRCEGCDEPIPVARLKALPFAIRCTRCQEEWERQAGSASRYAVSVALE